MLASPIPTKVPARKPVRPLSASVTPSVSIQASMNTQTSSSSSMDVQPMASAEQAAIAAAANVAGQSMNSTIEEVGGVASLPPTAESSVLLIQAPQPAATSHVSLDPTVQLSASGSIQFQQRPAQAASSTAHALPGPTNAQQLQPLKLSTVIPQLQSPPLFSIQAQSSLIIEASGSPPSYAQATNLPVPTLGTTRHNSSASKTSTPSYQHSSTATCGCPEAISQRCVGAATDRTTIYFHDYSSSFNCAVHYLSTLAASTIRRATGYPP